MGPNQQHRSAFPRLGPRGGLLLGLGVALLVAIAFPVFAVSHRAAQNQLSNLRPTGIPASVSTSLADMMALSPVPQSTAPNFTLDFWWR